MEIRKHKLSFAKKKATTRIGYASCAHIGNPSVHEEGLHNQINRFKKIPWWHVGDLIESILPFDKRFSIKEHQFTTLENMTRAQQLVARAKATCMGLITGNHEVGGSRQIGDITEQIAANAGVPYLGMTAYLMLQCPKGECSVFTAHGKGSMGFNSGIYERDAVNRQNRLRRLLAPFEATLKAVGHYHRTIIAPEVLKNQGMVIGGEFKIRPQQVIEEWCVAAPSMFKTYTDGTMGSYAELAMYPPSGLGWIEVDVTRDGSIAAIHEINEDGDIVDTVEAKVVR